RAASCPRRVLQRRTLGTNGTSFSRIILRLLIVADAAAGCDTVPQEALHFAGIGHRCGVLVGGDYVAVETDFENAARAGPKSDFRQLGLECREQFLSEPGGAQQELTAGAVGDRDAPACHVM